MNLTKLIDSVPLATIQAGAVTGAIALSSGTEIKKTFQAVITGTGAVTATVLIQASNDTLNWLTLGTITLNGTTTATDGFASNAPWAAHRALIAQNGITGTSAVINVTMGS